MNSNPIEFVDIPIESLNPFFEFCPWSKDIMEKDVGFVVDRFKFHQTKENWLVITVDWKLKDEKDRGYLVRYAREGGRKTGNFEKSIEFFFPEIEASPDSYKADYTEVERRYNGFGKCKFEVGLEITESIENQYEGKYPVIGYNYSHSDITKYGVVVYFSPKSFGEIEKVLVEHIEE